MSNLIFFSHVMKKNMSLKGITCITPINLELLKIYSTIFFKSIPNVIIHPRFVSVFEAHFQEPSTLGKSRFAMDTYAQNLE